jgi:hypothetical protein
MPARDQHLLLCAALATPDELEEPAPAVVMTAAEGGHGAEPEPTANVQAASVGDDDGAPMWLAVAALAIGALGLLTGIGGLMAGRRRTA